MELSPADHDRGDMRAMVALGIASIFTFVVDLASQYTRTPTGTRLHPEWVAAIRYLYEPLEAAGVSLAAARAISLAAVFMHAFIVVYLGAEGVAWMRRRNRRHKAIATDSRATEPVT